MEFLRTGEWHVDKHLDERVALKEAAFYGLEPKGALNDDLIVELLQKRSRRRTRELMDQNREKVMRICDRITLNFRRAIDNGEPLIASPVFMPDDPKKLVADHITQVRLWHGLSACIPRRLLPLPRISLTLSR